uniref:Uncharacterized protein n=1 Tax=Rhizophora mucronata TaxID=61149 RepID=A0A2P2MZ30_RHIMU
MLQNLLLFLFWNLHGNLYLFMLSPLLIIFRHPFWELRLN